MIKFKSLNQSKEFLRILKKRKFNTKYFTLYFEKNANKKNENKILHISFVVKQNVGNAVKRNKIKRKLKNAVRKIINENKQIDLNYTYVIFGRNDVYKDKFQMILEKISDTFSKIKNNRT